MAADPVWKVQATVTVWIAVPDAPDYEVSDDGQVRSLDRWVYYSDGRKRWYAGVSIIPSVQRNGYLGLNVGSGLFRHHVELHVLVAEVFIGPKPVGLTVRHADDNRYHNCAHNLSYGTWTENAQDAIRNGRNSKLKRNCCTRDHALVAPNLCEYMLPVRKCKACAQGWGDVRARRAKGISADIRELSDLRYRVIMGTS